MCSMQVHRQMNYAHKYLPVQEKPWVFEGYQWSTWW
jgi:hypothetical protein